MQSNRKFGSYECGYYAMQWMSTIVRATIDRGWYQLISQCKKHFKIWDLLFKH